MGMVTMKQAAWTVITERPQNNYEAPTSGTGAPLQAEINNSVRTDLAILIQSCLLHTRFKSGQFNIGQRRSLSSNRGSGQRQNIRIITASSTMMAW